MKRGFAPPQSLSKHECHAAVGCREEMNLLLRLKHGPTDAFASPSLLEAETASWPRMMTGSSRPPIDPLHGTGHSDI
jgi:hypothetical protein